MREISCLLSQAWREDYRRRFFALNGYGTVDENLVASFYRKRQRTVFHVVRVRVQGITRIRYGYVRILAAHNNRERTCRRCGVGVEHAFTGRKRIRRDRFAERLDFVGIARRAGRRRDIHDVRRLFICRIFNQNRFYRVCVRPFEFD